MEAAVTGTATPQKSPHDLSTEEWLALRRQSIGASEAAAACAEDPTVSPIELVCRKRGEMPDIDLSNVEAVQWGHLLEPAIVKETARRAKVELVPREDLVRMFENNPDTELVGFVEGRQPFLRSRARPWQTATPDGIGYSRELDYLVGIEAKNAGQYHSASWDTEEGKAPEKFQIQVAHQLAVAPVLNGGILSGLIGGNSLRSIRLERAKIVLVIDAVVAIETKMWGHIQNGTLPDLVGPPASVTKALKALHPDDNGESVVLPETILPIVARFEEAKKKASEWDKLAKELRSQLQAAIGNYSYGLLPDGSGSYSYLTVEKAAYQVGPQKYREVRFKKPRA